MKQNFFSVHDSFLVGWFGWRFYFFSSNANNIVKETKYFFFFFFAQSEFLLRVQSMHWRSGIFKVENIQDFCRLLWSLHFFPSTHKLVQVLEVIYTWQLSPEPHLISSANFPCVIQIMHYYNNKGSLFHITRRMNNYERLDQGKIVSRPCYWA